MNDQYQYLSYSGWSMYETCPLQYKRRYIDLDRGVHDPRSSLFGKSIGRVFEYFYDRQMWKMHDPVSEALSVIKESIVYAFEDNKYFPDRNNVDDVLFCKNLKDELIQWIPNGVEIIRKHKLLSEHTKTELNLDTIYKSDKYDFPVKMGGRADFVHGMKEPWILDGKGGSKEWVDSSQLIWYATQHYLKFHVAPVRLGYIFWKYVDEPITWIDYDSSDIRYCVKQVYQAANNIRLKMFDPKPSSKCKICSYKTSCEVGKNYIDSMLSSSKPTVNSSESILQIDDL